MKSRGFLCLGKTNSRYYNLEIWFFASRFQNLEFFLEIDRTKRYLEEIDPRTSNFLEDRTFSVKLEGTLSSQRSIKCGVPKGGVLSPTIFSCYINDVPLTEGANEKSLLFADDIVYMLSFSYKKNNRVCKEASEDAKSKCQEYLNKLEQWMNLWHISLAPHKCAQITFSRSNNNEHDDLDIKLYNQKIPYDPSPKFFGITFDKRLNFEKHN